MKKKLLISFVVGLFMVGIAGTSSATAIIDPISGWTGDFSWQGLGQINGIEGSSSDVDWGITVAENSVMTMATAWDDYVPGDEFSMYLDGTEVGWTNTYTDSSGYFHGVYDNLFLSTGSHLLTMYVTTTAPGYLSGTAHAHFSGISGTNPVPEPATMLLFGTGLAGLVGLRRRKAKK
ncbi:PEP-CTERM sorting domain-containing protein [Desulfobacterota bacterium M19]